MTTRSTCSACTASAASIGVIAHRRVRDRRALDRPATARRLARPDRRQSRARCSTQLVGVAVTVAWSGVCTFVILKVVGFITALRVTPEAEQMGLDVSLHGESIHS